MEMHLRVNTDDMQIPVLPESFDITDQQNNETVTIHSIGEITLLGNSGLMSTSISSFFPHRNSGYGFLDAAAAEPYYYVNKIKTWMKNKETPVLIITDTDVQRNVTIDEFTYGREDATGDVKYTLTLKEFRTPEGRTVKNVTSARYTVRTGDTLAKIAYKYLGSTSYRNYLYTQNKKAIEAAFKAHQKALKKAGKAQVKSKTSMKGKYLYKGTKLVIKKKVV